MKQLILTACCFLMANLALSQTQLEMNEEAHARYQTTDKELNGVYQKILSDYKADKTFIKNLRASQNLWVKFRDAEMNVKFPEKTPGYYGSFHPVCWSDYLARLTKKRTQELQHWLTGSEEGNMCAGSIRIKE